jgi:AP2-associated kinase
MYVESNLDYLRDREMAPGRNFDAPSLLRRTTSSAIDDSAPEPEEKNVRSSVDFLRAIEREEHPEHKHKHRRSSSHSKHAKRGSLSSLTSNIVKGKFGDAFRRFEHHKTPEHERDQPPLTPTDPLLDPKSDKLTLTPIAGSEATGGLSDDDRSAIDDAADLPPEARRELERRRLSAEEHRVSAAAAEYRQRVASQAPGKPRAPSSKASFIQNRVKNLLDESSKPAPASRTAEGYGKYTDTGKPLPLRPQDQTARMPPAIARKPLGVNTPPPQGDFAYAKPSSVRPNLPPPVPSSSAPPAINLRTPSGPAPRAPPKPKKLQTGGSAASPTKASREQGEDYDVDVDVSGFSKRYPSLSGLEMVEKEIPRRGVRDV